MSPSATRFPISPLFILLLAITSAGGWLCATYAGPVRTLGIVLLVLGGWAVSLCLHEFGHAAVAYRGGDTEVVNKGYLTLDIRRYADFGLSFVLPIFFLLLGAIPLPGGAVWINNWAIPSRLVRSLVSLAGPLMNLVLGALIAVSTQTFTMSDGLFYGMSYLALIQLLAFVLNILPVPGLDGWGAIEPYLSPEARQFGARVRPWAPLVLFLALVAVASVAAIFFNLGISLLWAFGGDPSGAMTGYSEFRFWAR